MKRTIYFLLALLVSGTMFMGCEEKLADDPVADQVAEDIASTLGSSTSGISSEIQGVSLMVNLYSLGVKSGGITDTVYSTAKSFISLNEEGTQITFRYDYDLNWGLVLENSILHAYYNSSISGSFDAPRISASDERSTNWKLTGLGGGSTEYILNGRSNRAGTTQLKIEDQVEITSTSDIVFNNVTVNKETLEITGGSLDWAIAGVIDGESFSYDATVVYKGDNLAQININGHKYSVNIEIGEIEE
ncbi:MAG TPA: hypothetical protein GXZ49_08750 [Bacteroidetes bacterium]|nr:hypothetical protein [Bacteroidota bacterium]